MKKGDVLSVARIAGIMAAKRTSELVPLCHPIGIEKVSVEFDVVGSSSAENSKETTSIPWQGTGQDDACPFHTSASSSSSSPRIMEENENSGFGRVDITATVQCSGKTGVEMEALTAASVAALTVYDMCKAVDKGMRIEGLSLARKEGGKSGVWIEGQSVTESEAEK